MRIIVYTRNPNKNIELVCLIINPNIIMKDVFENQDIKYKNDFLYLNSLNVYKS